METDADQSGLCIVHQDDQLVVDIEHQLLPSTKLGWGAVPTQLSAQLLQIEALDQRAEGLR